MRYLYLCFISFALFQFAANGESPQSLENTGAWKVDRKEPVRISGNVLSSQEYVGEKGSERGIHLKLATDEGDVQVQVGPRWVKRDDPLSFEPGEPITIVGIKITFDKKPKVIASEIIRGKKVYKVRELSEKKNP